MTSHTISCCLYNQNTILFVLSRKVDSDKEDMRQQVYAQINVSSTNPGQELFPFAFARSPGLFCCMNGHTTEPHIPINNNQKFTLGHYWPEKRAASPSVFCLQFSGQMEDRWRFQSCYLSLKHAVHQAVYLGRITYCVVFASVSQYVFMCERLCVII